MIDRDFAEFIHHDKRITLVFYEVVHERSLTAAKKTRDDHYRRTAVGNHTFISSA